MAQLRFTGYKGEEPYFGEAKLTEGKLYEVTGLTKQYWYRHKYRRGLENIQIIDNVGLALWEDSRYFSFAREAK